MNRTLTPPVPGRMRSTAKSSRRGISLIEVIASLMIMGTLVVSMLTSMARGVRGIALAERELISAQFARELIANWRLDGADLTVEATGAFPDHPGWHWSRSARPRQVADGVSVTEVKVAIVLMSESPFDPAWRRDFPVWVSQKENLGHGP